MRKYWQRNGKETDKKTVIIRRICLKMYIAAEMC